jgi:hypothetical protein
VAKNTNAICIPQGFRTKEEVQRFADLMEEMCTIVATKHSGKWRWVLQYWVEAESWCCCQLHPLQGCTKLPTTL